MKSLLFPVLRCYFVSYLLYCYIVSTQEWGWMLCKSLLWLLEPFGVVLLSNVIKHYIVTVKLFIFKQNKLLKESTQPCSCVKYDCKAFGMLIEITNVVSYERKAS